MSGSCAIPTAESRSTRSPASGTPRRRTWPTRRSGSGSAPRPRCASGVSWATRSPTAAPLGSALNRFAHYSRVVSDALVVRIDAERDAAWVRLDVQPAMRAFRPAVDARLAALLAACRELAGAPVTPLLVQLSYRQPADVKEYERFFGAPLEFGALASSFLLRSEDLARRLAEGGPDAGRLSGDPRRAEAREHRRGAHAPRAGAPRAVGRAERADADRGGRRAQPGGQRSHAPAPAAPGGNSFAKLLTELRREMAPSLLRDGQPRRFRSGVPAGLRGSERVPPGLPAVVRDARPDPSAAPPTSRGLAPRRSVSPTARNLSSATSVGLRLRG